MSNRERKISHLAISAVLALVSGGFLVGMLTLRSTPVYAHVVPSPCDFTTGGGFVITDQGNHANFGLVGGCKHGGFFGHVNFVDHDTTGFFAGFHLSSTSIDGYFEPFPGSNVRDICGTANTNLPPPNDTGVKFRARTEDNGDPNPGGIGVDKFGLKVAKNGASAVVVSTRLLRGGDIELHKPNPSTTGPSTPPDEITACGSDDSGLGF
jgi:hypothetical protein